MRTITVLPSTAGHATAQLLFTVLRDQRLAYDVMTAAQFIRSAYGRASMVVVLVRAFDAATLDLVRSLRQLMVPAFFVVEALTEDDEVTLLHSGVYDVVAATASRSVIGARMRTMYHHVHEGAPSLSPLHFSNVTVHPEQHEVMVDGRRVPVTRTEFRLLLLLAEHPDTVQEKSVLTELLGRESGELSVHALESHASRLRLKITEAGGPRLIHSVRGVGYQLLKPVRARRSTAPAYSSFGMVDPSAQHG